MGTVKREDIQAIEPSQAEARATVGQREPYASSQAREYYMDALRKGVSNIAALPGMASDVLLGGGRKALGSFAGDEDGSTEGHPFLGSEWIRNRVDPFLGVQNKPPKSDLQRFMGKAIEYETTNLPGLIATRRLAPPGAGRTAATISETIAPVEGATFSEIGREAGGELGGDRGAELGESFGTLAGGGTVYPLTKAVTRAGEQGRALFQREGAASAAERRVGKQLHAAIQGDPLVAERMKRAAEVESQIPGLKFNLAERTGSRGMGDLTRSMQSKSPEAITRAYIERQAADTAIAGFKESTMPELGPGPIERVMRGHLKKVETAEKELAATNQKMRDMADALERGSQAETGERLRVLRDQAQRQASALEKTKYGDVYAAAEAAGIRPVINDVRAFAAEQVSADPNAFQTLPASYHKVLRKWAEKAETPEAPAGNILEYLRREEAANVPKHVSFEELHSLYKDINADIGSAILAADFNKRRYLEDLRRVVSDKIMLYEGPEFGNVGALFKEANRFHAEDFVPTFREGLGGAMTTRTRIGDATPDSLIVRKLILRPDYEEGIRDFFQIYGTSPDALQLLQNGVWDMYAKAAFDPKKQIVDVGRAKAFMRSYDKQLSDQRMAPIRKQLEDFTGMADRLVDRAGQLEQERKMYGKTIAAGIAKVHPEDVQATNQVLDKAITSPRYMQALWAEAKRKPEGQTNLARAIAERISEQKDPWDFYVVNKKNLDPVLAKLGPRHTKNLETIIKAASIQKGYQLPGHAEMPALHQDELHAAIGTGVAGITSLLRAIYRRYMSPQYVGVDLGSRFIFKKRAEEAEKLLAAAIYDPQVAETLAKTITKDKLTTEDLYNLSYHYANQGIRAFTLNQAREQREQERRAPAGATP